MRSDARRARGASNIVTGSSTGSPTAAASGAEAARDRPTTTRGLARRAEPREVLRAFPVGPRDAPGKHAEEALVEVGADGDGRGSMREDLRARLARLDAAAHERTAVLISARELRRVIARGIHDWLALFERHRAEARTTVLRPLLAARIPLVSRTTPEGRFYAFEAPLSWGGIVSGLLGAAAGRVTLVVPPAG